MRLVSLAVVALTACGPSPRPADDVPSAAEPASAAPGSGPDPAPVPAATGPTRRWIPGDTHLHLAPLDTAEGQRLTVAELARLGPDAGLEFVIVTPHVHPSTWRVANKRRAWLARWSAMAAAARAVPGFVIIPGTEYTAWGFGHFGVSGIDLATVGDDFLASATAQGGLVIVNHPFAEPTHIPGIPISERDLSFRPWTERGAAPHLDGVEVWNLPLALANLATRHGGRTGEDRAFAAADALARAERRPIAIAGGSDSHRPHVFPTTWVLAAEASEAAILAAMRAGATCVGGPEAGTLVAHGDRDPAGRWAAIGDTVHATTTVELRWAGRGHLFVDGVDTGAHDGAFTHTAAAGVHTYRLVQGTSRCGFIYANL